MKNLFKLAPIALGLLALASCSSDDFMSQKNELKGQKQLTIELAAPVTDEPSMRSLFNSKNELIWQYNDKMNVYDKNLVQYDEYIYSTKGDVFTTRTGYVEEPTYVLFGETNGYGGWRNNSAGKAELYAVVKLSSPIVFEDYPAESPITSQDVPAYLSNIPLFGKITESEGGQIKGQMVYLTGWLKIEVQNGANKVKAIKVESLTKKDGAANADMPLTGYFDGIMDTENEFATIDVNTSKLVKNTDDMLKGSYGTEIIVDTRNLGEFTSYVYVPIVAGTYPALKVTSSIDYNGTTGSFTNQIALFEKKVIAAGHSYAKNEKGEAMQVLTAVASEATTLADLQKDIEAYAEKGKAVEIQANNITVSGTSDNTLTIPANAPALTLTLTSLTSSAADVKIAGGEGAGELTLNVTTSLSLGEGKALDLSDYKGNVTLGEISESVDVKAPKANVLLTVESDMGTIKGQGSAIAVAGDNITVEEIVNEGNGDIEVCDLNTVTELSNGQSNESKAANTGNIVIAGKVETLTQYSTGTITLEKTTVPQTNADPTYRYGEIGELDIMKANTGGLSGEGHVTTSITNASTSPISLKIYTNNTQTGDVASAGDVTIEGQVNNNGIPSVALKTGTTGFTGTGSGSTLKGGTITLKNVTLNSKVEGQSDVVLDNVAAATATVSAKTNATIKVARKTNTNTSVEPGTLTSVTFGGNLTLTEGIITTLVYNGTAAKTVSTTGLTAIENVTDAQNKLTFTSTWDGKSAIASESGNIYTAAQLAGIDNEADSYTLKANIDLGGNNLGDITLEKSFSGEGNPVISGLSITDDNVYEDAEENVGLFSTIDVKTNTLEVGGFEVKDAKINVEVSKIGILAGSVTGTTGSLKIKNVKVSGTVGYDEASEDVFAVGGLVGEVTSGTVTINESTSNVTLNGYHSLGGFVGVLTAGTLNFGKEVTSSNTVTANFNTYYDSKKEKDENYGKVGYFLGSATQGNVDVTAANAISGGTDLTSAASREALGFDKNWILIDGDRAYYHVNKGHVGYSGTNEQSYTTDSNGDIERISYPTGVNITQGVFETKPSNKIADAVLYYYKKK